MWSPRPRQTFPMTMKLNSTALLGSDPRCLVAMRNLATPLLRQPQSLPALFSSLPVHIITSGLTRSGFPLTCVCIHSYLCIVYVPTIPVRSGKRDGRSPADHQNPAGLGDAGEIGREWVAGRLECGPDHGAFEGL